MQDLNLHMFSHGFRLASGHNAGFCQPSEVNATKLAVLAGIEPALLP